jgi:sigma-B regulation protein RsbU (phosphoserine phosphatase)
MLELRDFYHLPQVDRIIEQLVADHTGLVVVAGLDPRPASQRTRVSGYLPSGRLTIFRILMRQMLIARPSAQAIVVTEDRDAVRVPRQFRDQIHFSLVKTPYTYTGRIADAIERRPDLLVINQLTAETAQPALEAAQSGLRVLSQLDTIFRDAEVKHHLLELGVARELLSYLTWVVAVDRVRTLCERCKQPTSVEPGQLDELCRRFPALKETLNAGTFFQSVGCSGCRQTGRSGDVTAFDIYKADPSDPLEGASVLQMEAYLLQLAAIGLVPLSDALRPDADRLRHTYHLLTTSEQTLADVNRQLGRRLAELEAANQVLQGRTEALISLHDIGQALITSASLAELGVRVCRHTRGLCGADRAILYILQPGGAAEVMAVNGWDPELVGRRIGADLVLNHDEKTEPTPYSRYPPGIPPRHPDVAGVALRAGLRVPLTAQGVSVGLMIVHTTIKPGFTPGEVALLKTFANQAAVAIQRAGLIDQLREKIAQLEVAQAELVKKERLDREMELARQVQQSVLPRVFPLMPGYRFGARNQPARQVGGDFYDVILLDGDTFGVVIADVSDKGMPAALYMALTRSLLLAEARRERSPRAVLNNVHRLLLELGEPDMFVTVFYGVVDGRARRLRYSRAGHDLPLLLPAGDAQSLGGEGTFLGFPDMDELHLSEEETNLMPGDRLVLFTDGLVDLLSPEGTSFGLSRLKSILFASGHLLPDGLCRATFGELSAYQGDAEQYDDMTMLVVDVL